MEVALQTKLNYKILKIQELAQVVGLQLGIKRKGRNRKK